MDDDANFCELMDECARLLRIIERRTRPVPKPRIFKHGTQYGYERHLVEGTMCNECRALNTERQRKKRARQKAIRELL